MTGRVGAAPGAHPTTVRRWRSGGHPNSHHLMAFLDLADTIGLGHSLTVPTAVDITDMGSASVQAGREQTSWHSRAKAPQVHVLNASTRPRGYAVGNQSGATKYINRRHGSSKSHEFAVLDAGLPHLPCPRLLAVPSRPWALFFEWPSLWCSNFKRTSA